MRRLLTQTLGLLERIARAVDFDTTEAHEARIRSLEERQPAGPSRRETETVR